MKLGILSDTHDNLENTRRALDVFRQHDVEQIIHCGDITIPPIVALFGEWPVVFVFGNLDRGHAELAAAVKRLSGTCSIGFEYAGNLGGSSIAVYHGNDDEYLASLISSSRYDYVFHGHTHRRRDDTVGRTRVINPGALGGRGRARSVCVLTLPNGPARFIDIDEI
ncbi:MAG: metallophosphoesterase family protein [Anaerolineae bacterium]|nr:metallophosphoesterase family protein [Anaerolineae bacterium]